MTTNTPIFGSVTSPCRKAGAETTVLIVDDSLIDRRLAGRTLEKHGGWTLAFASNGVEALAFMERTLPRAVLAGLHMPLMDGAALAGEIGARHPGLPVVLMDGSADQESAELARRSGAVGLVAKENLAADLVAMIEPLLEVEQHVGDRERALASLTHRQSRFALPSDPALVGPLVAHLQEELVWTGICDSASAGRVGLALKEALLNAIYHGNLEIDPNLYRLDPVAFQHLVEQRMNQAPFCDRRVSLFANLTRAEAAYVILDQGRGFDSAALPDPDHPAEPDGARSSGVRLMRSCMDRVTFNQAGNQVTLLKRREPNPKRLLE